MVRIGREHEELIVKPQDNLVINYKLILLAQKHSRAKYSTTAAAMNGSPEVYS